MTKTASFRRAMEPAGGLLIAHVNSKYTKAIDPAKAAATALIRATLAAELTGFAFTAVPRLEFVDSATPSSSVGAVNELIDGKTTAEDFQ